MFELSANSEMTMSSLDFLNNYINPARESIGEPVVQNRHFIARVEDELDDLGAGKFITRFGNTMKVYELTIDQMMLVGMRESKQVRKSIRDKLKELNKKAQPEIPQTYADALLLAANQAKELEEKNQALALAAPKAEFVDRYVESTGLMTFRQVAKQLEIKETAFRSFLVAIKAMYLLNGSWVAYQSHIDSGKFKQKAGEKNGHAFVTTKFTAKGVEWIAKKWGEVKGMAA